MPFTVERQMGKLDEIDGALTWFCAGANLSLPWERSKMERLLLSPGLINHIISREM
jgi:hypothetical protein